MSKKLLIGVAVLSLAFIGSSFAAVENIKVSGDITAQALTRDLSLEEETVSADGDDFIFSQIRLRFDADLTENVSATIGLINERLWGDEMTATDGNSDLALDLASVELKEFLYQPLNLTVGRQPLRYGSGLIVGDPDTNQGADAANTNDVTPIAFGDLSLRKSFDAVKAVLDYSPYAIDVIYAKVDEGASVNQNDDIVLAGANVVYMWDSYNGLTEGYFFLSDNERANDTEAVPEPNQSKTYVVGLRSQLDPNDHLTVSIESAFQFGDSYNAGTIVESASDSRYAKRKAWAALTSAEYRFLNNYNAKIGGGYTFLSGDNVNSNGNEGWDPMYEDTTCGEIINHMFAASNCHLVNLNGSYMPREDMTLGLNYCKALLAEKLPDLTSSAEGNPTAYSATYSPNYGPASGNTYNIDNDEITIGDEIDAYAIYDYTEDVQLKLTSAFFLPGDLFNEDNDELAYSIRGGLSVSF
jgi:hypothetical protein